MKNGRVVLDTENVRVRMHEVEKGKMSFAIEGYGSREAGMDDLYVWIDKLTTAAQRLSEPQRAAALDFADGVRAAVARQVGN